MSRLLRRARAAAVDLAARSLIGVAVMAPAHALSFAGIAIRYSRDDAWLCARPPAGWRCTRGLHLDGPCAAVPTWWNWSRFARAVRRGARRPARATNIATAVGPGSVAIAGDRVEVQRRRGEHR